MRDVLPVHPGEMLNEEFLKPMGLSKYRLAKSIDVPAPRIGEIVAGRRAITADTDLRLCRFFGLSDGWWLALQARYDLAIAREKIAEKLSCIHRFQSQTAQHA
ncbi:MAG: HigA family addiction module antitoxin [Polaromonas sp.]